MGCGGAACRKPPSPSSTVTAASPAQTGATATTPAPGAAGATPPPAPAKPMPAALPDVLARVNGEAVKKADLERLIKNMELSANQPIPPERRDEILRRALDQLVTYTLLSQETRARKVTVTDAEIDRIRRCRPVGRHRLRSPLVTTEILVVCHANICRSPMAAALLEQRLRARGVADLPGRLGRCRAGRRTREPAQRVGDAPPRPRPGRASQPSLAARVRCRCRSRGRHGAGTGARSHPLRPRRGRDVSRSRNSCAGPTQCARVVRMNRSWLERVQLGRERSMLVGFDAADGVADPYGGSLDDFERTAVELEGLLDRVVTLGWGRAV